MNTDEHRWKNPFLSVCICVHLWILFAFKRITIRTRARAVKWTDSVWKGNGGKSSALVLVDFAMDERLNYGPQEFLGDNVHHLRPHFVQHALDDRFDKRRIR